MPSLCQQLPHVFPRRTILEQHERESCYLRDVALATEQNYAKNNHEATLNFQSARDDIKYKARGGTAEEPFRACKQSTRQSLGGGRSPTPVSVPRASRRSSTAACSWVGRWRCSGSSSREPCRATRRPPSTRRSLLRR